MFLVCLAFQFFAFFRGPSGGKHRIAPLRQEKRCGLAESVGRAGYQHGWFIHLDNPKAL
jgi:hypothetical protein